MSERHQRHADAQLPPSSWTWHAGPIFPIVGACNLMVVRRNLRLAWLAVTLTASAPILAYAHIHVGAHGEIIEHCAAAEPADTDAYHDHSDSNNGTAPHCLYCLGSSAGLAPAPHWPGLSCHPLSQSQSPQRSEDRMSTRSFSRTPHHGAWLGIPPTSADRTTEIIADARQLGRAFAGSGQQEHGQVIATYRNGPRAVADAVTSYSVLRTAPVPCPLGPASPEPFISYCVLRLSAQYCVQHRGDVTHRPQADGGEASGQVSS